MLNIVRFELNNATHWGLLDAAQVRTLNLACTTTAELLALPKERLLEAAGGASQPSLVCDFCHPSQRRPWCIAKAPTTAST